MNATGNLKRPITNSDTLVGRLRAASRPTVKKLTLEEVRKKFGEKAYQHVLKKQNASDK